MGKTSMKDIIRAAGSVAILASKIGVTRQAVYNWDRIPAEMVVEVEKATGIARELLRPDLFRQPRGR